MIYRGSTKIIIKKTFLKLNLSGLNKIEPFKFNGSGCIIQNNDSEWSGGKGRDLANTVKVVSENLSEEVNFFFLVLF